MTVQKQTFDPNEQIRWSYLLYGPSKGGKTTFSAQFPKVLFITAEPGPMGGLASIRKFGHPYIKLHSWDEAFALLPKLKPKDPDVDTLHISLTFLSKLCLADVLKDKNRDQAQIQDYGVVGDRIRNFVISVTELPYTPIFECNDHIVVIKTPDGDKYNQIDPDLYGRSARDMPAIIDEVFYVYRERRFDPKKKEFEQGAFFLTCPDPAKGVVIAGDRSTNLDMLEKADYSQIIKKINS